MKNFWSCVLAVCLMAVAINASDDCPVKHPCTCSERESLDRGDVIKYIDIFCSRTGAQELPEVSWKTSPENVEVDKFTFSDNTVDTLKNDSFAILRPKIVDLRDSSLTSIEMGAFNGVENRLEVLDISGNDRLDFPKSLLPTLKALKTLDISGTTVSDVDQPFFVSASLEKLSMRHIMRESNIKHVTPFTGVVNLFAGVVNLKYLDLSRNDLNHIPKAITKCYTLERLDLSINSIDTIPTGLFKNLNKLKWLSLAGNYLEDDSFNNKTFDGLQNSLEELYIGDNPLTIPTVAISGLRKLRTLRICNADVRSVKKRDFEALESLETLLICEMINDIAVRKGAFNNIKSTLKVLSLASIGLKRVPSEALGELHHLIELDLSANNISRLSSADFKGLYSLAVLNLAWNQHLTIEDDAFESIAFTLLGLNLYSLKIETIPKAVRLLKALQKLNIGKNKFVEIDAGFFTGIHASIIIMNRCEVRDIHSSAFGNLYKLTHKKIDIDLSHNEVKSLDFIEKSEMFSSVNIEHQHEIDCGCHEFLLASCPGLTINGICNTPPGVNGEKIGSKWFNRELEKTCNHLESSEPVCGGGPTNSALKNNYLSGYLSVLFGLMLYSFYTF